MLVSLDLKMWPVALVLERSAANPRVTRSNLTWRNNSGDNLKRSIYSSVKEFCIKVFYLWLNRKKK